jgi:PAS domain S-box-containing protein
MIKAIGVLSGRATDMARGMDSGQPILGIVGASRPARRVAAIALLGALLLHAPLRAQEARPAPALPVAADLPPALTPGPQRARLAQAHVLLLSPYSFGHADIELLTSSYLNAMQQAGLPAENVHVAFLDLNRAWDAPMRARRRELLLAQYANQKLDLIIALQQPALSYMLGELDQLAPGVPLLTDTEPTTPALAGAKRPIYLQALVPDVGATMEAVLRLLPDTRRVVVTGGMAPADRLFQRQAEVALAPWMRKLEIEFTQNMALAEQLRYVAALPPHSVVISGAFHRDRNGTALSHTAMTQAVLHSANAPVFVLFDTTLGEGMVGGVVHRLAQDGQLLASHAQQLLLQPPTARSGLVRLAGAPSQAVFDWRQLQRWQLDAALLPPSAQLLYRPPSLWLEHRSTVLWTAASFVTLSMLLAVLMLQRRRLAAAELASRDHEERLRALVEYAPEAILVMDLDQARFVDANSKAEQLLGYARAELLSMHPARLYAPGQFGDSDGQEEVLGNAERAYAGAALSFERTVQRSDGSTIPVEVHLCRLPAGGQRWLRCSYADISQRKQAEAELLAHRNRLEELVQQRTAALSVAVAEAHAANDARNIFMANMSHELRTPLNAVIGFSQMLADSPSMFDEDKRHLAIINRAGHHLLNLINDILELSKIEGGRVQLALAPLALQPLLAEVLDMARPNAERGGVTLGLSCGELPTQVMVDASRLRQVLLKLLNNAVKFVQHGSITLSLDSLPLSAGRARLSFAVRDTGPGIALADQQRIFEPFVQTAHGSTRGGSGLGLTIAREFVRLMGGELQLRSQPGQGAEFRFAIEVEVVRAPAPAPAVLRAVSGLPQAEQGRRLLVVDDVDDSRELLRKLLLPFGFEITEARDGASAMPLLQERRFDLLVLDWRMPGMDGLALTRWLRRQTDLAQPRIVVLTASAFEDERQEALAAGADGFLRKPLQREQLFAMLAQQLDLHFTTREDNPAPAATPLMPLQAADLAALDVALRASLMQAVRELDLKQVELLQAELTQQDAALAARLAAMLARHQYQQLWELLRAAGERGTDV